MATHREFLFRPTFLLNQLIRHVLCLPNRSRLQKGGKTLGAIDVYEISELLKFLFLFEGQHHERKEVQINSKKRQQSIFAPTLCAFHKV
jgi:hypothetical protein